MYAFGCIRVENLEDMLFCQKWEGSVSVEERGAERVWGQVDTIPWGEKGGEWNVYRGSRLIYHPVCINLCFCIAQTDKRTHTSMQIRRRKFSQSKKSLKQWVGFFKEDLKLGKIE